MAEDSIKEIEAKIKKNNVKFLQLAFTDMNGAIKNVVIPASRAAEAIGDGIWFDGSSIEGFARIHESDMFFRADPSTMKIIPWARNSVDKLAQFYGWVFLPDGKPFAGDPRTVLKNVCDEAKEMGYTYKVGPELEFYLFTKKEDGLAPVAHDAGGYFDFAPRDLASDVRLDIFLALEKLGISIEASHHEVGPGQHEINFKYGEAVETADNAATFKYAVKSISHVHGLHASFMPKPLYGVNGSGMHVHQSMFRGKENAFYADGNDYNLSEEAKHFLGGQIKHIKALCAFTNPTINSYKRLVPGYEAPVYICWAKTNRSAMIRVPRHLKGNKNAARIELRNPDPSANPYLAFAAMLKAGLDGIKNKINPPAPVEEDIYGFSDQDLKEKNIEKLPFSLSHALEHLLEDKVVSSTLDGQSLKKYYKAKKSECRDYNRQVTEWELKTYFELI